ncbi:MAG: hypothetical protein JJE36_03190 [Coriobacteriia bacterium]|nr:hypothetical protein [Coriobacteriia bacterium]
MKKTLQVLALAAVLVFAFATVASAKYASYTDAFNYLPWTKVVIPVTEHGSDVAVPTDFGANVLYNAVNGTTGQTQSSPHGGYTQTSVKCAVCHSIHRAFSGDADGAALATAGLGTNYFLTNGGTTCVACHASWGASPSTALVEVGEGDSGPHIGVAGSSCTEKGCHGSMHGANPSDYATVRKYNLANPRSVTASGAPADIDSQLNAAIVAGNLNGEITQDALTPDMKAFVTGYVCSPCHNHSQFSVATAPGAESTGAFGGAVAGSDDQMAIRTGHPSAGGASYIPTCEGCHDLVGVATKTTAFPHANSGISVYSTGRYNFKGDDGTPFATNPAFASVSNATPGAETEQYGLWMTSNASGIDTTGAINDNATPISGASTNGFNLQDGACLKCHSTSATSGHPLP